MNKTDIKHNKYKKWLAVILAVICLTAAGCGPASGSDTGSEAADNGSGNTTFVPGSFEWSGGSGKIEMTCPQVRMEGDQAYATIVIDSEHYSWLKVDGKEYPTEQGNGTSSAEIPVILDEKMEISGLTTAMSQPHEVTYTICVGSKGTENGSGTAENEGSVAADSTGEGAGAAGGTGEGAGDAGGTGEGAGAAGSTGEEAGVSADAMKTERGPAEIEGLTFDHALETDYAECFDVYYYQDGFKLLDIHGDTRCLLIPEGKDLPAGVAAADASGKAVDGDDGDAVFGTLADGERIIVLRQPVQNVYLAATAVMALVNSIDAIDAVRLTGTDADGWYLDAPKKALESGEMIYAGKYSEPDYELLIQEGCSLAIESTMIDHTPEVKEKLEELDIPVLTDHSSYEEHPLGRAEWVKLYGALFSQEDAAEKQFAGQKEAVAELESLENTGKTVAFFYISQDGTAVVRSAEDYIPRMIEIAGGQYIFSDLEAAAGSSAAVNLSMEEFYATASDADYLVYNASIDAPLNGMQDLLAKSDLFSEFKAVQDGQVWTTDKNLYQATDSIGQFIKDLHLMMTDGKEDEMAFLKRVV
ncbi:MAG: ABC transporter substrate-binding protein [Eubacterium sp.]|nr:ABC transporter substrate-binding protein [Eubacterium sp.]